MVDLSMFDLLFTTRIPDTLRFIGFGPYHWGAVLITAAVIFFVCAAVKKRDEAKRRKILRTLAVLVPCVYISRFIVFLLLDIFVEPQMPFADRLPFHLCTLSAVIIIPLAVLSKNKLLLNFVYAVSLPGTAGAMLTPAMSYYGRYAFFSWQVVFFYVDHGLMALVAILCVVSGYFRPEPKQIPRVIVFFSLYAAVIFVVNKIVHQNYLFLNYPDEGTVMAMLAVYFGNPGYIVPLAAIAVLVIILMYIPVLLRIKGKDHNMNEGDVS